MTTTSEAAPRVDLRAERGIPFGRLLGVELRKLTDTRSGRWLLITILGLSLVAIAAFAVWGREGMTSWSAMLGVAMIPVQLLLPVLGILTMTAEWTQRTALVTFSLEPRRLRVIVAKSAAALLLGLLVTLVAAGVVAGVVAVLQAAGQVTAVDIWQIEGRWLLRQGMLLLVSLLMGLGLGLLLGKSALAVVLYYLIPTVLPMLSLVPQLHDVVPWVDPNSVTMPFVDFPAPEQGPENLVAKAVTAALLWIVAPLLAGTWITLRREAK